MICLDTTPLIWGFQKEPPATADPGLVACMASYIRRLDQTKTRIMVPAPVLAEFLHGVDDPAGIARLIQSRCFVAPFDEAAARQAARISRAHEAWLRDRRLQVPKQAVKVDVMIIATAMVRRAECFVTQDVDLFKALADHRVRVISVMDTDGDRPLLAGIRD